MNDYNYLGKVKTFNALWFVVLLSFLSCSGKDLKNLEKQKMRWKDLPTEVQKGYLSNFRGGILNLDSNEYDVSYKNTAVVGIWKGKKVFTIGDRKFHLDWNGNKENSFVFYKEKLYYLYDPSGGGPLTFIETSVELYEYVEIDLKPYL